MQSMNLDFFTNENLTLQLIKSSTSVVKNNITQVVFVIARIEIIFKSTCVVSTVSSFSQKGRSCWPWKNTQVENRKSEAKSQKQGENSACVTLFE